MADVWQTVRVFISSTFRDMHSERDWLVKRVFPALRERLEKYRVHLIDIDLRWGVTEQQANSGGALDVCLNQIDTCRPFFLGILGERYGFTSNELLKRIASNSKYHSLHNASGKSITELEILYGVLNDPKMYDHAFFCFRDPSFIDNVPTEQQPNLQAENDESATKLMALKEAIRQTPLPRKPVTYKCEYAGLRINWRLAKLELKGKDADLAVLDKVAHDGLVDPGEYDSLNKDQRDLVNRFGTVHLSGLEAFGEQVKDWLWESIRRQLNLPDEPPTASMGGTDPLAEEADFHKRYMENRTRVYVGREKVMLALTKFVDGDLTVPCLVTGPSGSGKSAALAHFVQSLQLQIEKQESQIVLIPHFVGASPASTSLRLVLRRLCLKLKNEFGFSEEVEQDPQRLLTQFREFLGRVPSDRRVLIVFDALNQLDETDRAHELHWLPWEFPPHVKIIISCIDDPGRDERLLNVLRKRKHLEHRIEVLTDEERRQIVRRVPSLSAKTLDDGQVSLLLENKATRNPLFLLVALEELRGFGSFEQLNAHIRALPQTGDTVTALFVQVIQRLESEFGIKLTHSVLTLLASARRGLSEREFQELTASDGRRDDLFAILRQLRPYLQPRGEMVDFYHRNLFKAVREKYLQVAHDEIAAHTQLGDYLAGQDYFLESLDEQRQRAKRLPSTPRPVNVRKIDELLWQRLRARDATACEKLLTDLKYLEARNEAGMVFDLTEDFRTVVEALPQNRPRRRILKLLEEAVRRDIHFIARHRDDYPQALFQCLWNSCWWYDCPVAATHYESGQAPGDASQVGLHQVLEQWRSAREQTQLDTIWMRSLRPPLVHVGSPLRQCLRGHESQVKSTVCSPDGTRIVSGSSDKTIWVWDAATGKALKTLRGHEGSVNGVSFSPDCRLIISCSADQSVRVWDSTTGEAVVSLRGHEYDVNSVSVSPDGCRIVSGSSDNTIRIWDWKAATELVVLRGHSEAVKCVSYSPDGKWVISGSRDQSIRVWDAVTGFAVAVLSGHKRGVNSVCYSRDGKRIVSGSDDKSVRVWDAASGMELLVLSGHEIDVRGVAFSPDARHIVSGSSDQTVRLWDAASGSLLAVFSGHTCFVVSVSFTPDGKAIVSGSWDKTVRVWESNPDCAQAGLRWQDRYIKCVGFSPSGDRVISGSAIESAQIQPAWRHQPRQSQWALIGLLRVWDAESGTEQSVLCGHEAVVWSVAFSEDGNRILSGSKDTTVRVWDALEGDELIVLSGHEQDVISVAFSADGRRIASGSKDTTVRVWDALSGKEIAVLRGHVNDVSCVAFSKDGRRLISGSYDKTVRVWDLESMTQLTAICGHTRWVERVSIAPDGQRIVCETTDKMMRVWDLESGQCLELIPGSGDITSIAAGAIAFPYLVFQRAGETVVESAGNGRVLARFVEPLDLLVTQPFGRKFAGVSDHRMYLIALEGVLDRTNVRNSE